MPAGFRILPGPKRADPKLLGPHVRHGVHRADAGGRQLDGTFYKLHAEVDQEHGLLRKEIVKKYADTKELQEACINAQLMKNSMRWVMSDCIYMEYDVRGEKLKSSAAAAA